MKNYRKNLIGLATKFEYGSLSLIWFFPISYLAVLLGHLLLLKEDTSLLELNLFAAIISLLSCGSLYLFDLLITKFWNNPIRSVVKLTAVALVGSARGAAIYVLAVVVKLDSGVELSYRIWNSTVTTLVWLCLFSLLINQQRKFQSRYRQLVSHSILKRSSEMSEAELTGYLTKIEQSLKAIRLDGTQPEQLSLAAAEVRRQLNESIRPLSKRLWLDSLSEYPKIRPIRVLIDAISQLRFNVTALSTFYLATSIVNLAALFPITESISRSLITLTISLFIYYLLVQISFKTKNANLVYGIAKLSLIAVIPNLISDQLHRSLFFTSDSSLVGILLFPVPILMILFSMLYLINQDRNQLISTIAQDLAKSEISFQKTHVASYLHNSLQSELLALAKRLESAAIAGDGQQHRASLEQLSALLNRSISEDFANFYHSPKQRLEQVITNWNGIIDISISNIDALFLDPKKSVVAVQIIEELASNAVKHSASSDLSIRSTFEEGFLILEILNIQLPQNILNSGFGSDLIRTFLVSNTMSDQSQIKLII